MLGNGTWINIGGNQAIGYGGLNADPLTGPYADGDGGKATRRLDVCNDDTCDWTDDGSNYMTTRRWYPTLETLEDGSMIVVSYPLSCSLFCAPVLTGSNRNRLVDVIGEDTSTTLDRTTLPTNSTLQEEDPSVSTFSPLLFPPTCSP